MGISVRLNKKKLEELQFLLPSRVLAIMNEQVAGGEQLAKQLAPVDTGFMREHIEALPGEKRGSQVVAKLVSPAPYSAYVEFGTSVSPAQPFMTPAVETVRRGLATAFRRAFQR